MSRLLVALAAAALLLAAPGSAGAVSSCGGQKDDCKCGKNNPYPCCSNGGNCTWWAWHAACCNWKVGLPGWGNAKQWAGNAKANPSYDVRSSPVAGSIGVRVSGSYGHVVWVTKVSGSTITVTEMNCWGNYGMRTKTYSTSYFDGGYIVRKSQCACTPGKKESRACGNCGKQTRTCASSCKWGSWSACAGSGACPAKKSESRACGKCGAQTRTCSSSCSWGSWGACAGEGPCTAGAQEQQPCGHNGQRQRSCGKDCKWGAWGPCVERDAGAAPPDSAVAPPDAGGRDRPAGWEGTGQDLPYSAPGASYNTLEGGCGVASGGPGPGALLLLLLLIRRRAACSL